MLVLGLGGNIGDTISYFVRAIALLLQHKVIEGKVLYSNIYRSKALIKPHMPKIWDIDFLNMVIIAKSSKNPYNILKLLAKIEKDLGRKDLESWSPRKIDIDILFYNDIILNDKILTIPHIGIKERNFVLFPLIDVFQEHMDYIKNQSPNLINIVNLENLIHLKQKNLKNIEQIYSGVIMQNKVNIELLHYKKELIYKNEQTK